MKTWLATGQVLWLNRVGSCKSNLCLLLLVGCNGLLKYVHSPAGVWKLLFDKTKTKKSIQQVLYMTGCRRFDSIWGESLTVSFMSCMFFCSAWSFGSSTLILSVKLFCSPLISSKTFWNRYKHSDINALSTQWHYYCWCCCCCCFCFYLVHFIFMYQGFLGLLRIFKSFFPLFLLERNYKWLTSCGIWVCRKRERSFKTYPLLQIRYYCQGLTFLIEQFLNSVCQLFFCYWRNKMWQTNKYMQKQNNHNIRIS